MIVGWDTSCPTDDDLNSYPVIDVTSDRPWNPDLLNDLLFVSYAESINSSPIWTSKKPKISIDQLARMWMISEDQARLTLQTTTQDYIRQSIRAPFKRYSTEFTSGHNYRRLDERFYSDTAFSKYRSLGGNKCVQVIASREFIWVHPMPRKGLAGDALRRFHEEIGVPKIMRVDNSLEQTGENSDFRMRCNKVGTRMEQTEPKSPWQNQAERWIGYLKQRWKLRMRFNDVPSCLWDYGLVYESEILNRTTRTNGSRTA